jgi:hypothetical protein
MKVDTLLFRALTWWKVTGIRASGLHDVDWIFHSMSTWQVHCDAAMRRRGPVPTIGPERQKEVHHRRTGETRAVSAAFIHTSAQEI